MGEPLIEWKIENFSRWCEAVHGRCIRSPECLSGFFETVELYPRGQSGQDDRMDVLFCGVKIDFTIHLSFGFDGALICSKQGKITVGQGRRILGPRLEEVLNNKKACHKDVVKLSFRCRDCGISVYDNFKQLMYSTIKISKVSLKIDAESLKYPVHIFVTGFNIFVFALDDNFYTLNLKCIRKSGKILLYLIPNKKSKKTFSVDSYINLVSSEEAIIRHEENKHVFVDEEPWAFSESITERILEENGNTINLLIEIVDGSIVHSYNYRSRTKVSVVPNGSLNFYEPKLLTSSASTNQCDDSVSVLTKELLYLYQDQKFSDCQLKCGDITFPVHKIILSARSPVFETMLSGDMQEAASGQVDIRDLDPSTLSRFLRFLYTGSVGEEGLEEESALNLYYAADKYQVPTLKKECVNFLRSKVSVSNVCNILSLADKHKNDDLMAASHKFILDNYSDVLSSEEWEKFMENQPTLALKTVTHFARKKHVGKLNIP